MDRALLKKNKKKYWFPRLVALWKENVIVHGLARLAQNEGAII